VRRCVKLASQFVLRHFRWFDGRNYLFKLSRTLELLIIKPKFLIIYEFPRNDTPASHTYAHAHTHTHIHTFNTIIVNLCQYLQCNIAMSIDSPNIGNFVISSFSTWHYFRSGVDVYAFVTFEKKRLLLHVYVCMTWTYRFTERIWIILRKWSKTSKVISLNDQFVAAINAKRCPRVQLCPFMGPVMLKMVLDNDDGSTTIFDLTA